MDATSRNMAGALAGQRACANARVKFAEDKAIEAKHVPNAELRSCDSPRDHRVATPSRAGSGFMRFRDECVSELPAR